MKKIFLILLCVCGINVFGQYRPNYYTTNSNPTLSPYATNINYNLIFTNAPTVVTNAVFNWALKSGTTDQQSFSFPTNNIGWYVVAWTWVVTNSPAAWAGNPAEIGIYFYFDIETLDFLTSQVETHSGPLAANSPTSGFSTWISNPSPIYFQHPQANLLTISYDDVGTGGEEIKGYIRFYMKRETFN